MSIPSPDSILQNALNGDRKPVFPISIVCFGKMIPLCHFKHLPSDEMWSGFELPELQPENLWNAFLFENPIFASQIEQSEQVKKKAYSQFVLAISNDAHVDIAGFQFSPFKKDVLRRLLQGSASSGSMLDKVLVSKTIIAYKDDGAEGEAACQVLGKVCNGTGIVQLTRERFEEQAEVKGKLDELARTMSLKVAQLIKESPSEYSAIKNLTLFYDELLRLYQVASKDLTRNSFVKLENHLQGHKSDLSKCVPILDGLKIGNTRNRLMSLLGVEERRLNQNQSIRSGEFKKLVLVLEEFNPAPSRQIVIHKVRRPAYLSQGKVVRKADADYAEVPKKHNGWLFVALVIMVISILVTKAILDTNRTVPLSPSAQPAATKNNGEGKGIGDSTVPVLGKKPNGSDQLAASINIETTPSGADIRINGQVRGRSPFQLQLVKGDYSVQVTKQGYRPENSRIFVKDAMLGRRTGYKFDLKPTIPDLTGKWSGTGDFEPGGTKMELAIETQTAETFLGELVVSLQAGTSQSRVSGRIDISSYRITFEEQQISVSGSGVFDGSLSQNGQTISGTWQNYSKSRTVSWSLRR